MEACVIFVGCAQGACWGYVLFEDVLFRWFPTYLPNLNLRVCVICILVIQDASHNGFDHFMCMFVLENHLSI